MSADAIASSLLNDIAEALIKKNSTPGTNIDVDQLYEGGDPIQGLHITITLKPSNSTIEYDLLLEKVDTGIDEDEEE